MTKIHYGTAVRTCGGGSPKVEQPAAIEETDAASVASRDTERKRRRAAASNTFLTSASNTSTPATGSKTLLGM